MDSREVSVASQIRQSKVLRKNGELKVEYRLLSLFMSIKASSWRIADSVDFLSEKLCCFEANKEFRIGLSRRRNSFSKILLNISNKRERIETSWCGSI